MNRISADLQRTIGFYGDIPKEERDAARRRLREYLALRMTAAGLPCPTTGRSEELVQLMHGLLENHRQKSRLLQQSACPADRRIEAFIKRYLADERPNGIKLPRGSFVLDRHGMARELSLPANGHEFKNDAVSSFRIGNGILNNPKHDRRTTAGTFHICEGGLPIAYDKKAVPKETFARLLESAVAAPPDYLELPFTDGEDESASCFVSLLLRPLVVPGVPGVRREKRMETRFFVPGVFVSNLDFVESIFGNGGDPYLPENDAGLDVHHWTGHTGCVLLAPWLTQHTKRELGLPHVSEATPRQKRDGMCYEDDAELYNDGAPFKLTCRDSSGVVITLIADNYYGYSKKEVKTQISYAANLYGESEEEHAGGAIAFASFMLGEEFRVDSRRYNGGTLREVCERYSDQIEAKPEGYGVDRDFANLIYIHESARVSMTEQKILWEEGGITQSIPLQPDHVYMAPSGYKIRLEKHPGAPSWRLIGTVPQGAFCHKPNTVSGGGKSEISKSIVDYKHYGPVFVADFDKDMALVEEILERDYRSRWCDDSPQKPNYAELGRESRKILDSERRLGSVIKLLTPSNDYTDEYNDWLTGIPNHVRALVFAIKRFYHESWGDDWRSHFSVDRINGQPGHELKFDDRKLVGTYLRIGYLKGNTWRTFKLRQDFAAAAKIQTEDDISVSITLPKDRVEPLPAFYPDSHSVKFVENCEFRLFQRPDDAIHRGLDKQTEHDLSEPDNFISNFEPLSAERVQEMRKSVVEFDAFTKPMQEFLTDLDEETQWVACSANPRRIGDVVTKNPRYLQKRPDLVRPLDYHVAMMGTKLHFKLAADEPVHMPVLAVLMGRRNNPPDKTAGIKSLAVWNPIHFQELPELFIDLVCSLTGKSPSTTGAGSEGALTKGPFNMLLPAADLNAALVSYILTNLPVFSTPAGHIGPDVQVDHDLSLMIPEIWSRLSPHETDPQHLIKERCLERVPDMEYDGKTVSARTLGYRITSRFVRRYFGRVFDDPDRVFDEAMLKPETQDPEAFAEGLLHMQEAYERVARQYIEDDTVADLVPPLRSLIYIMAEGNHNGLTLDSPELREQFTLEYLLKSDWYQARLDSKQQVEVQLYEQHVAYLTERLDDRGDLSGDERAEVQQLLDEVQVRLKYVASAEYRQELVGTIGCDPSLIANGVSPAELLAAAEV